MLLYESIHFCQNRMKINYYLLVTSLFALTLAGCSKSDDTITPAPVPATTATINLLTRKWSFSDISVKTDSKSYAIPVQNAGIYGDDNVLTFDKSSTFSYLDYGKTATGTWMLPNDKALVLIDADRITSTWTINTLTTTSLDLSSIVVDLTKGRDLTDTKIYKPEEQNIGALTLLMLASLDKRAGGTIDFSKEPEAKTVQLILKGKAK